MPNASILLSFILLAVVAGNTSAQQVASFEHVVAPGPNFVLFLEPITMPANSSLNITSTVSLCDWTGTQCPSGQGSTVANAALLCGFGRFDPFAPPYESVRLGATQTIVVSQMSPEVKSSNNESLHCGVFVPAYMPSPVRIQVTAAVTTITPLAAAQQEAAGAIHHACCNSSVTAEVCQPWDMATTAAGIPLTANGSMTDFCNMDNNLCDAQGNLISLNLGAYHLSCNLSTLDFSNFTKLQYLYLYDNDLQGDAEAGLQAVAKALPTLKELDISSNGYFAGQLLDSTTGGACSMVASGLQFLALEGSPISGPLPSCLFGSQSQLQELWVGNTDLSGALPSAVSTAPGLRVLDVPNTNVAGTVPSPLPPALLYLNVTATSIKGAMPDFSKATSIVIADLSALQLSGTVTESVANHPSLFYLDISGNDLTGLPTAWTASSSSVVGAPPLFSLFLYNNPLNTAFPAGLMTYPNLTVIVLDNTSLTGALPELPKGGFPSLLQFYASNNSFTGSIPSSWSGALMFTPRAASAFKYFYMANDSLSGQLPSFLGQAYSQIDIYLAGNDFSNACDTQFEVLSLCASSSPSGGGGVLSPSTSGTASSGSGGSTLSAGAIVGIIIVVVVLLGSLVAGFIFWRRRRQAAGTFERFDDSGAAVEMGPQRGTAENNNIYNPHLDP